MSRPPESHLSGTAPSTPTPAGGDHTERSPASPAKAYVEPADTGTQVMALVFCITCRRQL
jgi:hypothetical protein